MDQILTWQPEAERGGDEPAILRMNLCGEDVVVTFTEKHLLDLQEMAGANAQPGAFDSPGLAERD